VDIAHPAGGEVRDQLVPAETPRGAVCRVLGHSIVGAVRGRSVAAVVLAVVGASACKPDANYDDTHFRCPAESPECPDGFSCIAGFCERDGPDAAGPDGAPDATPDVCELAAQAPDNDLCSGAIDLTTAALTPAGATAYGDTTGYASNLNPPIIATCTGAMNPGPDAIYRVDAAANGTLAVTLTPTDWDGAVYVLDGCSGSATCLGGDDQGGDGSIDTDAISVTPGTYYVVVDSQQPGRAGCFTLHVEL
jgi:hypothetical protein